jgi:hypothetical protein
MKIMTENQEKLLLKDLSSRLPYGVKLQVSSWDDEKMEYVDKVDTLYSISIDNHVRTSSEDRDFYIDEVKPYLLPLSSMTEEQKEEHKDLLDNQYLSFDANGNVFTLQDFYCKYHLDYRGFIPDGLAEDATGLGIY